MTLTKSITIPLSFTSLTLHNQSEPIVSLLEYQIERQIYLIPSIEITLGSHKEKYNVYLSTLDNRFYISDYSGESQSKTYHSNHEVFSLDDINPGCKGMIASDDFTLGDITIKGFLFIHIIVRELGFEYKGKLGFSYAYRIKDVDNFEQQYSILYQLREKKYIDKYIISLSQDSLKPKLTIGDYPSSFPQNPNQFNYKTCPLLEKNPNGQLNHYWQCMLDSIYFSDYKFMKILTPMSFSLGGNMFAVPEAFFNELISLYFQKALDTKACRIHKGSTDKLYCNEYSILEFESISLIFNKWRLRLKMKHLFRYSRANESYLFVVFLNKEVYVNEWILGINLLQNCEVVFDGEKNVFGLIHIR